MSDNAQTITYDRVPLTLVHPSLAQDITLIYLLLPRDAADRRKVLQDSLPWLKQIRRWFVERETVVLQMDTFLTHLTWSDLNHIQVDIEKCFELRDVRLDAAQSSDYDLRLLFTLFPRNLSDEQFSTDVCLSLMR